MTFYLDLEYNRKANPKITQAENETLLNECISELTCELKNVFNITINRKHIIDLDSSTEKKFSRHFIVHFPNNELFTDAPACGVFVKNFVGRLAEEVATGEMGRKCPTLAKYLFVNTEVPTKDDNEKENNNTNNNKPKGCFIDIGVYTRNRIFRILGSSKYGKPSSAILRIASANEYPFADDFVNKLFFNPDDQDNERTASHGLIFEDEVRNEYCVFIYLFTSFFVS